MKREKERPAEERKREISETLVNQLAEMDDADQRQVLGFMQGIAYAKLTSKPA